MTEPTPLHAYAADHRLLLARAAEVAGFADPVAVNLNELRQSLLRNARKGPFYPVEGVLIRDWSRHGRSWSPNVPLGVRVYDAQGVRFVCVSFIVDNSFNDEGAEFIVVDRKDYARLYRIALKLFDGQVENSSVPILADDVFRRLKRNTLDYLQRDNLQRIRELGGRPKRGVLLFGPPGNGKTSACRWLWAKCIQLNWEYKTISADAYAMARRCQCAEAAVRDLFALDGIGIIVFDDFDLALRDRDAAPESDDQSVFLNALDGVRPTEGVVYIFTTNCPIERIDHAFRRPGRIDVVLTLDRPDRTMRRRLIDRWHADVRAGIDCEQACDSTDGFSFAELEEVKNQLILYFLESGRWDWTEALAAFRANRKDAKLTPMTMGFAPVNCVS